MMKDTKHTSDNKSAPVGTKPSPSDRAVKDTKQPEPTNHPTRKTDPSSQSFAQDEFIPGGDEEE